VAQNSDSSSRTIASSRRSSGSGRQKLKLVVENRDATPEEFEPLAETREGRRGRRPSSVLIGPLEAGTYDFFGEFNPKTATGKLIAN
jgi:hypothetical protein